MVLSTNDKSAIYNTILKNKEYREIKDILGSEHPTDEEKEMIKDVIADVLITQIDDVYNYVVERAAEEKAAKKTIEERAKATQELLDAIKKYKEVTNTTSKKYGSKDSTSDYYWTFLY